MTPIGSDLMPRQPRDVSAVTGWTAGSEATPSKWSLLHKETSGEAASSKAAVC